MKELSREEWPYYWFWREKLPLRQGQPCRIFAYIENNEIIVEFPDGIHYAVSRLAIRKRYD